MIHLIANTGIQFITTEMDFNPSEPIMVNDVPMPPLYFAEYPSGEPNINCFEMAYKFQNSSLLMSELRSQKCIKQKMDAYGEESDCLDASGQPVIDNSKINLNNLWQIRNPRTATKISTVCPSYLCLSLLRSWGCVNSCSLLARNASMASAPATISNSSPG